MDVSEALDRRGLAAALGAFGLWGVFPLFIGLLAPANPVEISAHRVVWTFATCLLVLAVVGTLRRTWTTASDRRLLARLALGAVFLASNWLIFVIAVEIDRVVDASLGYFLNPLVSAGLAVVVLRERLRPAQWVALGIAGVGIVVMAVGLGTVPWIALALAATFGMYGLTKKQVGGRVTALSGLSIETAVLLLPALVYLVVLQGSGASTFGADVGVGGLPGHSLLLVSSGFVSAVPLVLFAAAARRLPLATVAMTQFVAPVLQFLAGVVVLGEQMSTPRWIGFGFVWVALVVLSVDIVRSTRRPFRPSAEPEPTPA
ncbi:MAG TPA: EamA family transporter RarD [Actinotalea caeni]|uniref:EamA family transporter RarD n=1 Tax=Actinotalea caeni TaxID=1348467 RepID=UPI002B4B796C|nr:EamA family transporter RarD [Actinotalea caeni]HLV56961.1 EamA family transporter RarD [Actinotalea caeni]